MPDRFASSSFSARQRAYARNEHVSNVYTPGFVVDGMEWRGWFTNPDDAPLVRQPAKIAITVDFETFAGQLRVNGSADNYVGHAALLGFDQVTRVLRGENRGRELRHDFVVLEFEQLELEAGESSLVAPIRFEARPETAERYGLAVWVTEKGSMEPVQSLGGWLDADGSLLAADGC
ncbi:MAG: DUF1223 domain-containing protein [Gammaproteobacteria bacterium]|nr:DUF1223 domain-containing protein [Gammaproteobacteria bacterium]